MDLVRNLGVILDSQPLMKKKIVAIARGTFVQIHLVHQLHLFLDWETSLPVTHALVTSYANHYSVLYMRLPFETIQKLQLV